MTALELTMKLEKTKHCWTLQRLGANFCKRCHVFGDLFSSVRLRGRDGCGPRKNDGSGDAVFWTLFFAGLTLGALSSFAVTTLDDYQ
ncbi:hypothetical protein KIN20_019636 [Parelaphostrongylus tenuis]|uniref:Uncharacterized protein n=1 Tax=Parelaphostrongylus tenuis TaxID=148309 RepID=A0AAD5QT41_PARTN|nr:hypothetical protein KIN20_019636 [Parelaphostrongylus tenuis]